MAKFQKGNKEQAKRKTCAGGRRPRFVDAALKEAMRAIDWGDTTFADQVVLNMAEMAMERKGVLTLAVKVGEDGKETIVKKVVQHATEAAQKVNLRLFNGLYPETINHSISDEKSSTLSEAELNKARQEVKAALKVKHG
jgi:hypothetical protein